MTHEDAITIIEQLRELVPTNDGKWCPKCSKVVPLDTVEMWDSVEDWEKQTTCPKCGGELPPYDEDSTVDLISEVHGILTRSCVESGTQTT